MNSEIRERLTAYVLGEADENERKEMERLLGAGDELASELVAERERLEATIALVREFGGGAAELSPDRMAELTASASRGEIVPQPRVVPFHRRPVFAAAAAVLLAVGAGAIWFGPLHGGRTDWGGTETARVGSRPDATASRPSDRFESGYADKGADRRAGLDALGSDLLDTRAPAEEAEGSVLHLGIETESAAPSGGFVGVTGPVHESRRQLDTAVEKLAQGLSSGERQLGEVARSGRSYDDGSELSKDGDDAALAFDTETWNDAIGLGGGANEADREVRERAGNGVVDSVRRVDGGDGSTRGKGYKGPGDAQAPGSQLPPASLPTTSGGPTGPAPEPPSSPASAGPPVPGGPPGGGSKGPVTKGPGGSSLGGKRGAPSQGDGNADLKKELHDLPVDQSLEGLGYVANDPQAESGTYDFFLSDDGLADGGDARRRPVGTTALPEVDAEEPGEVDGRFDRFYFGLTEGKDVDGWSRDTLAPWAGDWEAMKRYESKRLTESGLPANDAGLRRFLEDMGCLELGSTVALDSPDVLAARWRLFGRGVLEARLQYVLDDCHRRKAESLRDMFFRHWGTRPFEFASVDRFSTFAADVDTSSYTLARNMLDQGIIPGADQIRVEEWVNYFDADLPQPTSGTFSITTQVVPNPAVAKDGEVSMLMRVGIQGREVADSQRSGLNLTFVVDTSGSMAEGNRIELVRNAMRQLLTKLDGRDKLAIVAFNNSSWTVLEPTVASNRAIVEAAISSLGSSGGTNVEAGLVNGFSLASQAYDQECENRVVLLSDGVGNIGETDQNRLLDEVARFRTNRIYLNTIGVGLQNHNDVFLEQLANRGEGISDYVDTPLEARRAFVENFTSKFQTIARDVKIQVEFDPQRVQRYRLIGYENRAVADRSFRDDKVDGGEVGAGHSVVALYELRGVDLTDVGESDALATVRLRYKPPVNGPQGDSSLEIEQRCGVGDVIWDFATAPAGLRRNVLVAQVAEVLKRSAHARGLSLDALDAAIQRAANDSPDEDFRSFAGLFARNRAAIGTLVRPTSPVESKLDTLRFMRYELELEKESPGARDPEKEAALAKRIEELENEVRTLVLDGVAKGPGAPQPETGATDGGDK
ncbi:MAG: von Willebrand factor type A domain-containing protein [Planctomycetota bacterium]